MRRWAHGVARCGVLVGASLGRAWPTWVPEAKFEESTKQLRRIGMDDTRDEAIPK